MKTKFNRNFLYGALITLLAAACTNDKTELNDNRVAIRVSADAQTRVVNNMWNEGDVIGISMIEPENGTIISPYANYDYVTGGDGNFSPNQALKIIYFPADGKNVSFKAYYPHKANIPENQIIPISVKNQVSQADIDLMTAEHLSGTSIDNPDVKLHFHHRLAKIFVDLTTDETGLIDLKDCKLTVKGLKTAASYDLMKEKLTDDASSTADISIPIRDAKGEAIWLPRVAGEGVTFEVTTADGGTYTARMDAGLELKAGYKHTFHIRLKSTPVTVSATIEEWIEGPERKTDVIRLVTGLDDSKDFQTKDTLRLYLKDSKQTDFGYTSTYTYGANGSWSTSSPIYWENIIADPASFRGATVIARKLNETQMDDILVSKDIEVAQYTGVNLEMQHAGARVIIELKSTDGTFTANDLKNATVVLPNYQNNASLNLANGSFVIGNGKANITPEGNIAIFPPQTIANSDLIAQITINGHVYYVKATESGGFEYKAGVSTKLTMDMHKSKVEMSATIAEWSEESHLFDEIRISTATLGDNEGDLKDGDELFIFTGNSSTRVPKGKHFTYDKNGDKWTYSDPQNPIYWADISTGDKIYGFIERPPISDSSESNQSADYIVTPNPVDNGGGATNVAVHFQMKHAVAKVIVILKSQTYSLDDLEKASVVLPGYMTGGSMDYGVYKPESTQKDIKIDKLTKMDAEAYVVSSAYLQPQDIAINGTVVKLSIDNRIYEARKNEVIKYEAGKATTLTLDIEKTDIGISAAVENWEPQLPPVEWNDALFFSITDSKSSGFSDGDEIAVYKLGADSKVAKNNTYIYGKQGENGYFTSTTPWYRDDFCAKDLISAVFPNTPVIATGENTMDWSSDGGNSPSKDILVATNKIVDDNAEVKLPFKHVLSKVTVNIIVGTGFSKDDLEDCTVTLKNLINKGTINIATGTATVASGSPGTVSTTKLDNPNSVNGKNIASSYEVLIMPQSVTASTNSKTTLVTVELDGNTYDAQIEAAKTFAGGQHYVYNITLAKTGLSFTATVADWMLGKGGDITIN